MNTTININLGGISFCIDQDAYSQLQNYLQSVERNLSSDTDKQDVMNDIEARMAELFSELLKTNHQSVISNDMVQVIIQRLGKPDDYKDDKPNESFGEKSINYAKNLFHRHLYRSRDDQVIAGVCSGLAHWMGINAVWVRLCFVLCLFIWGFTAFLYVILWLVVPQANTAAQRLDMRGEEVTVENIEREVKKQSSVDSQLSERSGCGSFLITLIKIAVWIVGGFFIFIAAVLLFSLITALLATLAGVAAASPIGFIASFGSGKIWLVILLVVLLLVVIGLPVFGLVYTLVKYAKGGEKVSPKAVWWGVAIWLLSLLTCIGIGVWQLTTNPDLDFFDFDKSYPTYRFFTDDDDDSDAPLSQLAVMPFNSLIINGAAKVNIIPSNEQYLEATLTDNATFDYEVTDSVLTVNVKKKRVRINVHTPQLSSLSFSGAANVEGDSLFIADNLHIKAAGASNLDLNLQVQQLLIETLGASTIELKGSADRLKLEVAGASNVDAEDFDVRVANINAIGASRVEVNVADSLFAYPSGASKINYHGMPIVISEVQSGGKIKHQ